MIRNQPAFSFLAQVFGSTRHPPLFLRLRVTSMVRRTLNVWVVAIDREQTLPARAQNFMS
jgi:hypothetical protein